MDDVGDTQRIRPVTGRGLPLAAAAAGAAVGGLAAVLLTAWLVPVPVVFLPVGCAAAVAVWFAALARFLRRWPDLPVRRWRTIGVLAVAVAVVTVLIPLDDPARPATAAPGAGVWTLPDGGRIAFGVVHARIGDPPRTPVVALHGGPGVPDVAGLLATLGPLTAAGHDIWSYEQRGSGRSSRLDDPGGYTVEAAVADLEQVRRLIGTDKLILLGHSYGAYLAAAYLAAHPDRVEKVILSSPGDLDQAGLGGQPQSRLDGAQRARLYTLLAPPRALLAYTLVQVNPAAAHALTGDGEVDARQDRVYAVTQSAMHCPGRTAPRLRGLGFYANQVPQSLGRPPVPDVRAALRAALVQVPVLVLKGQCDYLDWRSATAYLDVLPTGQLAYLPGAGHDAYVDRPDLYGAAVRAFVDGEPVPGRLTAPGRAPNDYQP